ncbi:iron ABC transporter permease [Rhodococcus sp. X156]|uniref:FecCD family ABC transporter permease n=1 Tax=Rhodococcus sp. X156 TaxID=2499145 RepID=UPI001F4A00C8|nr:iron ABC transporter permease [Rhodococcus sp. X156]
MQPTLRRTLLPVLVLATVAAAILAACIGQVPTSPTEVLGVLLHGVGLDWLDSPAHPAATDTLWHVRFPRVALGLLVGAALGCAGALLQGAFANPLAEPGVIGVSSGAAVGASAAIVIGGAGTAVWGVAGAAFVGGLLTTMLVYAMARSHQRTDVITLVLAGVAINAVAGGLIALFTYISSPTARDQIVFWQLGTLGSATWEAVALATGPIVLGALGAVLLSHQLDLLALGEAPARHLGVNVERLRLSVVALVALLVAAAVAFTGIIAFVGLVVPHAVRMLVGPGHRLLVPASAVAGALVLLVADMGARTLVHNADLPLGMLTALVGGPVFFVLILRTRARQGGWS